MDELYSCEIRQKHSRFRAGRSSSVFVIHAISKTPSKRKGNFLCFSQAPPLDLCILPWPVMKIMWQNRALQDVNVRDELFGFYSSLQFKALGSFFSFSVVVLQLPNQVMSDSLQPHGLQHTRHLCLSPCPGVCPSSCPLNQ